MIATMIMTIMLRQKDAPNTMSATSSDGRCCMSSRISRKLDLKLLRGMTGLCSNRSGGLRIISRVSSVIASSNVSSDWQCVCETIDKTTTCHQRHDTHHDQHQTHVREGVQARLPLFVSCCCANVSPTRVLGASSVIMGGAPR